MNSILIYAMPRSRSTAILESAKSKHKWFEPFNTNRIAREYNVSTIDECRRIVSEYYWHNNIMPQVYRPDVTVKMLGIEADRFPEAREFLRTVIRHRYTVYVPVRDIREIMWSLLLAPHYGFFMEENQEFRTEKCTISEGQIENARVHIHSFLQYLPKHSYLISWDHLPSAHFDRSRVTIKNQNSLDKKSLIENYEYCHDNIEKIVATYEPLWNAKVLTKPWAPL